MALHSKILRFTVKTHGPCHRLHYSSLGPRQVTSNLVSKTAAVAPQHHDLPLPDYFTKYAATYVRGTGHTTLNILEKVLTENVQTSAQPIGPESFVHDTAAGPGIGAIAIVNSLPKEHYPKKMLVSDSVPAMIGVARASLASSPLPQVECRVLDSQDESVLPTDSFTHSVNNFSILVFPRPVDAVREQHRTLRPGGLAVITTWRRFAPMFIVHAAQRKVKPDIPDDKLMPTPSPEFYEQGVLQQKVEEAGFTADKITVYDNVHLVTDLDKVAGLTGLMSGPFMARARETFNEEEQAKWPMAVKEAVKEEVEAHGGLRFEYYALLAFK